jgi:uncharacterized caspase-like protein
MGPILLFMKKALEIKEEDVQLAREVLDYYTGNGLVLDKHNFLR